MASYILNANGNWDASNIWSTVDATNFLDSEAANTALTTSFVESSTSTPGVETVDGLAVKIASRAASPTGTMTVHLAIAGVEVVGSAVTINVSDIHVGGTTANGGCGWFFFKFSSPLTLLGATLYSVGAKTSSSSQVNLYSSATTNWSRMVRTTSFGTPTTNDIMHVLGEKTAAGAQSTRTLTYNQTATTSFGKMTIGNGGTFTTANASSTAYYLKLAGIFRVTGGSVTNPGAMPTSSSFVTEFNCAGNVDFGLELIAALSVNWPGGASKTSITRMSADAAAAATVITVLDTTGWQGADTYLVSAQKINTVENKTGTSVDSSTQITLASGLTNQHSGTNSGGYDSRNYVGNLTRNVKIRGVSSSLCGYVLIDATSSCTFSEVEFYQLGSSTANKIGVDVQTTTGSSSFTDCPFHDFKSSSNSEVLVSGAASNNFTFTNCIFYNFGRNGFDINAATTGTNWTLNGCLSAGNVLAGYNCADIGGTLVNCIASGNTGNGLAMSEAASAAANFFTGLVTTNNSAANISISSCTGATGLTATSWGSNASGGLLWGASNSGAFQITLTAWGQNGIPNVLMNNPFYGILYLTLTGDRGPGTSGGQATNGNSTANISFQDQTDAVWLLNSVLSANNAVTTADIILGAVNAVCYGRNVTLNASTQVSGTTAKAGGSRIQGVFIDDLGQAHGAYSSWIPNGSTIYTIKRDTTIQDSGIDTFRITPAHATLKANSVIWTLNVDSGTTPTASVGVRCSVVGDGTVYNGNRPRLMMRANPCMGYGATDTVLATATSAANGAFQTISASLPASASESGAVELWVDADGTTGWINIQSTPTLA